MREQNAEFIRSLEIYLDDLKAHEVPSSQTARKLQELYFYTEHLIYNLPDYEPYNNNGIALRMMRETVRFYETVRRLMETGAYYVIDSEEIHHFDKILEHFSISKARIDAMRMDVLH